MPAKRLLDIVVALAALVVLGPLLVVLMLAIWLGDFASPLYIARRMARGGGTFPMVKLRSMRIAADRSGVNSTSASDPRITTIGRLIRATKLDELPQLWNVLAGEMSLVGPRPQVETDAGLYTDQEKRILTARPGITDLASIVFSDEGEILRGSHNPDLLYNQIIRPWKSRLALLYVEQRSLGADFAILGLTAIGLFSRPAALRGVQRILARWGADELLITMAGRLERPRPFPPPGASEIVQTYP